MVVYIVIVTERGDEMFAGAGFVHAFATEGRAKEFMAQTTNSSVYKDHLIEVVVEE